MSDDTHPCPVARCVLRVPDHQLMCKKHWRMVPAEIQQRVYRAWRGGRGAGSDEHIEAMNAAIASTEAKLAER